MQLRTDIPSGFGVIPQRLSGIHQGGDYLAPVGSKVTAADQGTVDRVGYAAGGLGHYIQIAHHNAKGDIVSYTLYGHLRDAPTLQRGDKVAAGDLVGISGQSGNARNTPPHVHLEIRTQSFPGRGLQNRCDPERARTGQDGACQ
jgi:murein DD-endopeptidase MepM/ murein hydrolase activator NlpD